MTIVRLETQNIKALKAVEIDAAGQSVVIVGGRNGAGKTSVLDSIMYALAGKHVQPPQPVRRGAKKGEILVDLGDLVVRRSITPGGGGSVRITAKDGAKITSPQALLDRLCGELTFDPLAFANARPAEQVETLRALTGVDFAPLDRQRAELYEERTAVGREAKSLRARVDARVLAEDVPDEEVDVSELLAELDRAQTITAHGARHRRDVAELERRVHVQAVEAERLDVAARRARIDLERCDDAVHLASAEYERTTAELEAMRAHVPEEADEASIKVRLAEAGTTNRLVQHGREAHRVAAAANIAANRVAVLTRAIDEVDAKKIVMLADANMPVAGLAFGEAGVEYLHTPFIQCSSAEQLRISVAIGIAKNPAIRVLLIRGGSSLDDEGLATVARMAADADGQVWIERVGDGEEVSVVIRDGVVAEDRMTDEEGGE